MQFLDPSVLWAGRIAREREPHQAARGLTRYELALEQHVAEQRLRLILALVGGEAEPARRELRILRPNGSFDVDAAQIVLCIGVAEVGRRISKHLARAIRIGF